MLTAQPALKELDVIGAKRPTAPGQVLTAKDTEQYVLKRKGKAGFKADKRWFDKSQLSAPAGCGLTTPVDFEVEPGERVHERAVAGCGRRTRRSQPRPTRPMARSCRWCSATARAAPSAASSCWATPVSPR